MPIITTESVILLTTLGIYRVNKEQVQQVINSINKQCHSVVSVLIITYESVTISYFIPILSEALNTSAIITMSL